MKASITPTTIRQKHMNELTDTERKILCVLARKGPMTYYDIYRKDKLCSSSTAWELIKDLEKHGYVEVKYEKPFQLRGRKKKLYGVTFRGLVGALREKESWEHIDDVANQQTNLLPSIFGKWQHFKENVDVKQLTDALKWFWLTPSLNMDLFPEVSDHQLMYLFMENLPSYILRQNSTAEERIGWLKAVHSDPELRQWMIDHETVFTNYVTLWSYSFDLLRKPKPDWNRAIKDLKTIETKLRGATKFDPNR